MPHYVIGHVKVRDPSWVKQYLATVPTLIEKHGGRYLVRGGKVEALEGPEPTRDRFFVVLQFPSVEAARAFYSDPAYAPFIELRKKGADTELILVEGI